MGNKWTLQDQWQKIGCSLKSEVVWNKRERKKTEIEKIYMLQIVVVKKKKTANWNEIKKNKMKRWNRIIWKGIREMQYNQTKPLMYILIVKKANENENKNRSKDKIE